MSHEFLLFANLTLLLRLRLLLVDNPAGARAWWRKTAVEATAVAALVSWCGFASGAIVTSVLLNAAAIWCDRRTRDRNAAHLSLGLVHLVALSVWFGPHGGVAFRPWLAEAADALRHWSTLGGMALTLVQPRALIILLGLLLAANEANLLIRWILARLQLRPGSASAHGIDAGEYARGRVIGLLERVLIYFFVLIGQYGAVGFTLAAKGFTRFKELENRSFAEYVLIGTLLSSGLAMFVAVAVRTAM